MKPYSYHEVLPHNICCTFKTIIIDLERFNKKPCPHNMLFSKILSLPQSRYLSSLPRLKFT